MPRAARAAGILVVDDDRLTRHLVRSVLSEAGYRVRLAKDGAEAIRRLRSETFDVMLLDVWMPRTDGLAVLDWLKRRKSAPTVIVLTSDDASTTVLKAMRHRAHLFARKPLEPDALLTLVRDVLKSGRLPPIEVVSARPEWVELSVPCTKESAERLHAVMAHLDADLPEEVRESVAYAFRELLLNAVEWGGKLDPKRRVRISYLRAKRMLLYRIADPGPGFAMDSVDHAAFNHPGDPIEHMVVREQKGLRPGGFGILMVRAKVDELIYNEAHNEVMFVKYLD